LKCKSHRNQRHLVGIAKITINVKAAVGIHIAIHAICKNCKTTNPIPSLHGKVGETYLLDTQNCCENPQVLVSYTSISVIEHLAEVDSIGINPRVMCTFCTEEQTDLRCDKCKAVYHKSCAKKWLEEKETLPPSFQCEYCKFDVPGLEYETDPKGYLVVCASRKMSHCDVEDCIRTSTNTPCSNFWASKRMPNGYIVRSRYMSFKTKRLAKKVWQDLKNKGANIKWNRNFLMTQKFAYLRYLKKNKLL